MSREDRTDAGSALVEFVLVSVLVVFITLGIIQTAITLHVRNIALSSASEGARVAAIHDRTVADGQARAVALMERAVATDVQAVGSRTVVDGLPVVAITVTTSVPVLGLFSVGQLSFTGRAFEEVDRGQWRP